MNVVDLTLKLCRISSISGDEAEVSRVVAHLLSELGFCVEKQQVGDVVGRDNIFAYAPNSKPEILLTTHIDTVGPFIEPYFSDDKAVLLGRGVCDAKGIAAAMICAAKQLLLKGETRVGLLFVVGEETVSDGAKTARENFAPKVRYFINGEPTDLKLVTHMKGAMVFDLETKGTAGHSAYPETGFSAVHQLCEDLNKLLKYEWPSNPESGHTTLNIGTIQGGVAGNVIAPHAEARCVMRLTQDVSSVEKQVKSLLHENTDVHVHTCISPVQLHTVEGFETCSVSFGSDVPHLKSLGVPLLIGPGSILDAHTSHEKILVKELEASVEIYQKLCGKLLETS